MSQTVTNQGHSGFYCHALMAPLMMAGAQIDRTRAPRGGLDVARSEIDGVCTTGVAVEIDPDNGGVLGIKIR